MKFRHSYRLIMRVLPGVACVIAAKLVAHHFQLEVVPLNAIFSALIGATVFLMGFLISGVLADYKESEKLPSDLAAALLSLQDEIAFLKHSQGCPSVAAGRTAYLLHLAEAIHQWFHKKVRTAEILALLDGLSAEFALLAQHLPPNYIARLKQEQSSLRRMILRIHTVRETDFVHSGYFIATTTTWLLMLGLVLLKLEPYVESLFFVALVAYLLLFLLRLIRDLDNPFGYYETDASEDVSLKPISDAIATLAKQAGGDTVPTSAPESP